MSNTTANRKCSRCKGKGGHWGRIFNHGTRQMEQHYVTCVMPGCHNGVMNLEENRRAFYGDDFGKKTIPGKQ